MSDEKDVHLAAVYFRKALVNTLFQSESWTGETALHRFMEII